MTPTREQLIERERGIRVERLRKITGLLNGFRDPWGDIAAEDAMMEIGKILEVPAEKLAPLTFGAPR